jgi:hypothetical protein
MINMADIALFLKSGHMTIHIFIKMSSSDTMCDRVVQYPNIVIQERNISHW